MIEFSMIEEAYPNSFLINKKKKVKEPFMNDYNNNADCYNKKKYDINMPSCPDKNEKFSNKNSCEPLQAPVYNVPIDDLSKKNFNEALKVSGINNNNNDFNFKFTDEMSNTNNIVKPYFNNDLDVYLNFNDSNNIIKNTNNTNNDNDIILNKLNSYLNLFDFNDDDNDTVNNINTNNINTNANNIDTFYKSLINLCIFIFIGIIIIIICDQITKLAFIVSMNEIKNNIYNNNINTNII